MSRTLATSSTTTFPPTRKTTFIKLVVPDEQEQRVLPLPSLPLKTVRVLVNCWAFFEKPSKRFPLSCRKWQCTVVVDEVVEDSVVDEDEAVDEVVAEDLEEQVATMLAWEEVEEEVVVVDGKKKDVSFT
jgi:hypothetical protein